MSIISKFNVTGEFHEHERAELMTKKVKKHFSSIRGFIEYLKTEKCVYIQTHDFPDHDAVASAFGLQYILKQFDITSAIIYSGSIQRESLKQLINRLDITMIEINSLHFLPKDKVIIVDGCKNNQNVSDLACEEVGVIDHHNVCTPDDVPFVDIRSEYGACSSIICHYIKELNLAFIPEIATALMVGISMDTASLTRNVNEKDLEAYYDTFNSADVSFVNYMMRNYLTLPDIDFFKILVDNVYVSDNIAWCYFKDGCKQNLLGILSDFVISIEEVEFAVLCARNKDRVNISVRNECSNWDASVVVKKLLEGAGFGGGHTNMAGGVIFDSKNFSEKDLKIKLNEILKRTDQKVVCKKNA